MLISLVYAHATASNDLHTPLSTSSVFVLICSVGLISSCHVVTCTSKAGGDLLCSSGLLSWILSLVVIVTIGVWTTAFVCSANWSGITECLQQVRVLIFRFATGFPLPPLSTVVYCISGI